jgi:hypothetical protein
MRGELVTGIDVDALTEDEILAGMQAILSVQRKYHASYLDHLPLSVIVEAVGQAIRPNRAVEAERDELQRRIDMALVEVNAPREWVMYSLTDLSGAVRSILTTGAAYAKARVVARDVIDVDVLTELAALMERSVYVESWPEDEQDLHRQPGWLSFQERNEAVVRFRAEKAYRLVAARVEQDVRQQIAEELCDCKDRGAPPTNPWTKKRIAHHCDCITVMLTSKPDEYGARHDHDCGRPGGSDAN